MAGADSEDEAYQLYLQLKEVLSHGSFNLRKFLSNSPHLQKQIDEKEATLTTTPESHPPPSIGSPLLHTAIVEIEAIVNSQPLSYVHPDDLEQPLTPSHLQVGRRLRSLPDHLLNQKMMRTLN